MHIIGDEGDVDEDHWALGYGANDQSKSPTVTHSGTGPTSPPTIWP